jgi:uncharacterized protein YeaO (DUF488 family)
LGNHGLTHCFMPVRLKRAYAEPAESDGFRVLVDRLWPRGLSKEQLKIDAWLKELAPSDELRTWFRHDPEKWDEFRRRYFLELASRESLLAEVAGRIREGRVTLVFAAADEQHNNAVALSEYLVQVMKAGDKARAGG